MLSHLQRFRDIRFVDRIEKVKLRRRNKLRPRLLGEILPTRNEKQAKWGGAEDAVRRGGWGIDGFDVNEGSAEGE
jgi:hypothetical protein